MSSRGASAEDDDPTEGGARAAFLFLGVFYLLLGVLVVVCGWILMGPATLGGSITFTLLGVIVLVAAALQVTYSSVLVRSFCGVCPPLRTAP
jgi:hypothetical protein